jgi:hypothetical protein
LYGNIEINYTSVQIKSKPDVCIANLLLHTAPVQSHDMQEILLNSDGLSCSCRLSYIIITRLIISMVGCPAPQKFLTTGNYQANTIR